MNGSVFLSGTEALALESIVLVDGVEALPEVEVELQHMALSIAISLKRIADAMEVPRFTIPDGLDLSDLSRGGFRGFRVMPDDGK